MTGPEPPYDDRLARRRTELAAGLARVEERIARACDDAGRERDEVTLVVVTKFFPARDVRLLQGLGVREIGESRAQEALAKFEELSSDGTAPVRTHFIGQLQSNKVGAAVGWADLIHTVDRPKLVTAIDRAAETTGVRQAVLVQVSLDSSETQAEVDGRGGVAPAGAVELATQIAEREHLDLAGVMAVAPRDGDPDAAFARLAELAQRLRQDHPGALVVSAGMSGDLEVAVRHGATHLRVGSAILGPRPPVR